MPKRLVGATSRHAGVLEDYGDLAEGLLALHQATAEGRRLDLAGDLPAACASASPGVVVVVGEPAAYGCRGFVCSAR